MDFSRWLNSLSIADQITILILFLFSALVSLALLKIGISRYNDYQKNQPFAPTVRISPFGFFSVALPISILSYLTFGDIVSRFIEGLGF